MAESENHSIKTGKPEDLCEIKRKKARRNKTTKVCGTTTIARSGVYVKEGMLAENRFVCFNKGLINPDKKLKGTNLPSPVGFRSELCSTDSSKKLKKILGYPVQGHHLLSCSMFEKVKKDNPGGEEGKPISFKNIMRGSGYDVNNGNNVFFLPGNFGHTKWDVIQRHVGSHNDKYYKKVYDELKNIYGKYKDKKCTEIDWKEVHQEFHDIEDDIFDVVKKGKLWLYDESECLFNADAGKGYRSEKGNSKDSGVEWVKHIKRNKKNWYIFKKYPFPVPDNAI